MDDLIGKRFGRLTVLAFAGRNRHHHPVYKVVCDCGTAKEVVKASMTRGLTESCGCWLRERLVETNRKHGMATPKTKTYIAWAGIIQRCEDSRHSTYQNYGAKGIRVCERWRASFAAFLEDMGEPPSKAHSIDRIDPLGHYEPSNCRWADCRTQQNNRTDNRRLTIGAVTKTITEWAREYSVPMDRVRQRLNLGYEPLQALTAKRWHRDQLEPKPDKPTVE